MEHSRTIDLSTFASPFDNFFNYVPKEHETAVRHAVYNVLAFAALFIVLLGGYYVVVVLNPFIVPLIWGVLGSSAKKCCFFYSCQVWTQLLPFLRLSADYGVKSIDFTP